MKLSGNDHDNIRIQVFLSRNGVCSRRKAFDLIKEGHVILNGEVCREPATPVDPHTGHVSVDGKKIKPKSYDYIMMNKPAGYTTTRLDRHADKVVLDLLPPRLRHLSPVGRLDKDSEGLLLLTNDGDTAYQLTHPKHHLDKTYFVRITGRLDFERKKLVETGVYIDGIRTKPAKIRNIRPGKFHTDLMITIQEGRKRQIRYMFAKVGHKVIYLKRLSQGPLTLGELKKGMWRRLTLQEIDRLRQL